ncbi:MAG TPA: hypothetical protein VF950_01320 [Planctomycetota bacterium]
MKNRRDIRQNLRDALNRAKGKGAQPPGKKPPPPPPPAGPVLYELSCLCGQLLRLPEEQDELRCACPACKRRFILALTEDQGRKIACPMYLEDSNSTGDTFIAEARGVVSRSTRKAKGGMDDALGPPPPPALACVCPSCSSPMKVSQALYDKRAKCPRCPARILLTVVYDPTVKKHSIQPLRITDAPSGDTKFF